MVFRPTIGLEIHAELRTRTKMFCNSANDPDEIRPNVNVCPICLAHPGTLPVINREAVRHIVRLGIAVGGTIADYSEFDRKSYFYPDIPKGYQISQYEHPLVSGGTLAGVAITRVHLEEDTARSTHTAGKTLVDFNRAGIPLMELVTEPVIPDAETAGAFARELQLLLRTLGASEANLEKGEMRIEANISLSDMEDRFGTKVEIKNLNSFRAVERAIAFEIARQSKLLSEGGKVEQETRGWDEAKQQTFHQRFKEGSADYRYFPEPDLPPLSLAEIPEFSHDVLIKSLPELPWVRRARYTALGIKKEYVEVLVSDEFLRTLFEGILKKSDVTDADLIRLAGNYLISDVVGLMQKDNGAPQENLIDNFFTLMEMTKAGQLSSRGTKEILQIMFEQGGDPKVIAKKRGLIQMNDASALVAIADAVIARETVAVKQYQAGSRAVLQYLIGKAMQESRGAGNPQTFRNLLEEKLT